MASLQPKDGHDLCPSCLGLERLREGLSENPGMNSRALGDGRMSSGSLSVVSPRSIFAREQLVLQTPRRLPPEPKSTSFNSDAAPSLQRGLPLPRSIQNMLPYSHCKA